MSFAHTNPHDSIVKAIKSVCSKHSIIALRADDKQYHDDLYQNILTYIYGCDFGIAIYERILQEEFNPNVAFEVGYMMGLRKPILMLKDKTLNALNTDLAGKMYKDFDPFDLEKTVTISLEKWLSDKEFIAM